jgi:hypothetical protein
MGEGGGEETKETNWQLSCILVPTLRLKSSTIQLGIQSDRQPLIEQSVSIDAPDHVHWIESRAPAHWAIEVVRDQSSVPSHKFRVVVRSQGKLSPRRVSDVIHLIPVSREEKRLPAKELKIVGEVVRDVMPVPREIHYGVQSPGTVVKEAIQLRSLTSRRFLVKKVPSGSDDLRVTRLAGERDEWIYSLELHVSKPGGQEVVADFLIEDEDGTEYTIAVPLRYHGRAGG